MKLQIGVISGLILFGLILTIVIPSIINTKNNDKLVTYEISFNSNLPDGIIGKLFVKKHHEWFLYSMLEGQPYSTDVGTLEYKGGSRFEQLPEITQLAIQYIPNNKIQIINVTGDGNYTNDFDIDGDMKPDYVFIKNVVWDDSEPKLDLQYRTQSINAHVDVSEMKQPMEIMRMDIENIINLTKNHPDLLSDSEVDILLSKAIGNSYGYTDLEVDRKAQAIMWKIADYFEGLKQK